MTGNNSDYKAQVIYFSHGGGPLPILGDPGHKAMNDFMKNLPSQLHKPDAIIVISAHWEEDVVTVQGNAKPKMFYDYYGFPEEAYKINYPAPGSPDLATKIIDILIESKVPCSIDSERGFDHGLFIPLKMMYPDADIPALQISLLNNLSPRDHVDLGKALSKLMSENILIIGSGFSFHNMREFFKGTSNKSDPQNDAFQDWLIQTCTGTMSEQVREHRLIEWKKTPFARYCHPREEHLLPLHVCVGMAQKNAELIFNDYIAGKRSVAFLWR